MRREPLPAPWTEKRRPAVLARAQPPCPRRARATSHARVGLGVVQAVALVNRFDCRKPASGTGSTRASGGGGALRRWKGTLDRGAPPSLTRGAEAAVLAPGRARSQGRVGAGATERVRGSLARLSDGRKRRPRRRVARSSVRGARYRAARDPRFGEGCGQGWPKRKERRQAPLHSSYSRVPCERLRPRAGFSPGRAPRRKPGRERRKSSEARECSWCRLVCRGR